MSRAEWVRGGRILGSAPWIALGVASGAAMLLLGIAALAHTTSLAVLTALLGLATCGATAAYVLDEEAGPVADATPTSHRHRAVWRMPLVCLPGLVALVGLVALDRLDPASHWLHLTPLTAGVLGLGVGIAAALRRGGAATPGDQAGVLTLAVALLLVLTDPARRWVSVAPLGDYPHVGRSVALWAAVVVCCAGVVLACTRDPGRSRRR